MKVIGKDGEGNYIAVVDHTELEKLTGKYYGKLHKLEVGEELNLGAGYDFATSIQRACSGMVEACEKFESSQALIRKFSVMVAGIEPKV